MVQIVQTKYGKFKTYPLLGVVVAGIYIALTNVTSLTDPVAWPAMGLMAICMIVYLYLTYLEVKDQ